MNKQFVAQTVDLREIPIGVINLASQPRRLSRITSTLRAAGLSFEVIEGVFAKPRFKGCGLAHLAAIRRFHGTEPFLVLEDDVTLTDDFEPIIKLPPECDLYYLGHSPFGASVDTRFQGFGSELATDYDGRHLQIHSMLAAHAILYVSSAGVAAVEASVAASCDDDTLRRHDIGLAELQQRLCVLGSRRPFFVQEPELQGKKRDLRAESRDYEVRPVTSGSLREIGTSRAVARTSEDGRLVWDTKLTTPAPLFGEPPSAYFEAADSLSRAPDPQGWNSEHPIFAKLIEELRPQSIIEIGVWKGASVIHMAKLAQAAALKCRIYAVDTWLGSPEHWLRDKLRADLMLRHGYPTLYETFLKNVRTAGVEDFIEPLPMPSETAAFVFAEKGVTADVIHIDAGHEYESVHRDLVQYTPLLAEDGVIVGDDYGGSFPGVRRAFNRFCQRHGLRLQKIGRKCICAREEVFANRVEPLLATQ